MFYKVENLDAKFDMNFKNTFLTLSQKLLGETLNTIRLLFSWYSKQHMSDLFDCGQEFKDKHYKNITIMFTSSVVMVNLKVIR